MILIRTLPMWDSWSQHKQSLRIGETAFLHTDDIELVRRFPKPVMLVKGMGSSKFLYDIITILAEEFPQVKVVEFPGGHAPQIISMQPFIESFENFLTSTGS